MSYILEIRKIAFYSEETQWKLYTESKCIIEYTTKLYQRMQIQMQSFNTHKNLSNSQIKLITGS